MIGPSEVYHYSKTAGVAPAARRSRWRAMAKKVIKRSEEMNSLADGDLTTAGRKLMWEAKAGTPLDKLLIESYALVRQSARRVLNMEHFEVQIIGAWSDTQLNIIVQDDGPGFPPDILAKLGEPYVTTRRSQPGYGGLGLGVFIAVTLIERIGGTVDLTNAMDGGARVSLTLPRAALEAEPMSDVGASDLSP